MPRLLDQYGNPIALREATAEPQTARLGGLHNEFAGHPTRGLTPPRLARILEEAEHGDLIAQADLYEDMEEKDAHIYAELQKRKLCLLGLDWEIRPPRNPSAAEEAAAGLATEILQDMTNLEDVILDMADGIGHGYANLEIEWQRQGREWLPASIQHRPQRWFQLDRETRTELRLRDNSADGAPLQPFGWIQHRHQAKSGYLSRSGLFRVLAWPFLFKNYSLRDLAEFLEIYGLPLRVGTYPTGASDTEKATLLRAVVNIGHAAAGIIPEGMAIEFKEAAKGQADPFRVMMDWCERSVSKAILGGTLTSQADGKSSTNALGNVHNEVRHDILVADARQIAATLTRDLIYPILALNTGAIDSLRRCPRLVFDLSEPEDISLYAEAVPRLVDAGLQIPTAWVRDKLRIPAAEDGEETLARPAAAPATAPLRAAPTTGHPAGCPCCATSVLKADAEPTVVDRYTERLNTEAQAALDGLIDPIRRAVMQAESLEDLQASLLSLYPTLAPDALAAKMQQAFAAAELAGRFEAREGK